MKNHIPVCKVEYRFNRRTGNGYFKINSPKQCDKATTTQGVIGLKKNEKSSIQETFAKASTFLRQSV